MSGERLSLHNIVSILERTGAIYLTPHKKKFASGRMSCLYFNIGDLIISFPREKELIVEALAQTYLATGISSERLIGVPEGVNCLASSLSDKLRIGQLRVRETMSEHGDQRLIEGSYKVGQTVAVFEDVMSTGGSSQRRTIEPLKAANLQPNVVITLIDREYGGISLMNNKLQLPAFAYTTTTEIAQELIKSSLLSDQQLRLLEQELEDLKTFKLTKTN